MVLSYRTQPRYYVLQCLVLLLSLTGFAESKHVELREAEHEATVKPPAISIQPRLERFFDESGLIFGSPGDL